MCPTHIDAGRATHSRSAFDAAECGRPRRPSRLLRPATCSVDQDAALVTRPEPTSKGQAAFDHVPAVMSGVEKKHA